MSKLSNGLKALWADNFVFYTKLHGYHLNVVGCEFHDNHKFLEDLYNYYQDSIDDLGELIRQLDEIAPANLKRIQELSSLRDEVEVPEFESMVDVLLKDIELIISRGNDVFDMCQSERAYGVQNALAEYLEQTGKFRWMLKASQEPAEVVAAEKKAGEVEATPVKM